MSRGLAQCAPPPHSALCAVCGEQPHKYRCPTCLARYCCARCFTAHKPGCEAPAQSSSSSSSSAPAHPEEAEEQEEEEEDVLARLPDARLAALASNPELRTAFRDPRVQRLFSSIDAAPGDRAAALEAARRGVEGQRLGALLDDMLVVAGVAERDPETGAVTFVGLPWSRRKPGAAAAAAAAEAAEAGGVEIVERPVAEADLAAVAAVVATVTTGGMVPE
jgi:zinc finger HIT domain-containing protein 3